MDGVWHNPPKAQGECWRVASSKQWLTGDFAALERDLLAALKPDGARWVEQLLNDPALPGRHPQCLTDEEGEAWMGLRRGGLIGVDVMRLKPLPKAEAIARDSFTPASRAALREETDPAREFGLAWIRIEVCCKCLKCWLAEWPEAAGTLARECATESVILQETLALTVATTLQAFLCRRNA